MFLDSVDEAKLRRLADFYTALDRLRDAIGKDALARSRIVLSSRISEWQPETDKDELRRRFALPPLPKRAEADHIVEADDPTPQEPILVVQLKPLDRERVELFVRARGVPSPEDFLAALDAAHAWEFARRPLDVVDLARYWADKRQIGSLTDLIEFSVESKTRETFPRERSDPLSRQAARDGVETLAAATAFARQLNFRVPDNASVAPDALDAQACLPTDWRPEQCRALLERPIFDAASYGRVRFHHRRVGEYLAAKWLERRLQDGCPIVELEELLFERTTSGRVMRPALAPVTAWLCSRSEPYAEHVRRWVLDAAPALHLHYGDPSRLPVSYKRQVLQALARRFSGRRRVWLASDPQTLSRLADQALANDITAIIVDRSTAPDLRAEMLALVRHGRLLACLDPALDIVASPIEPLDLKCHAAAALRDVADDARRRRLAEIAASLPAIPNSLCGILCRALYPGTIDSADLLSLLRKTDPIPEFSVDLPYFLESHFESAVMSEQAHHLLVALLELGHTPPLTSTRGEDPEVSEQFLWVGTVMPTVLVKLLAKPALREDESATAAAALRFVGIARRSRDYHPEIPDLNAATKRHPTVRRKFFWLALQNPQRQRERAPLYLFQVFAHDEILLPEAADFAWLVHDVRERQDPGDRELAVRLGTALWNETGRDRRKRRQMLSAIGGDAALRAAFQQVATTGTWRPVRRFWFRHVRQKIAQRWWWQHRRYELQRRLAHVRGQWNLLRHITLLTSGKATAWLAHLSSEANEGSENNQLTVTSWHRLRAKRGRIIAWATEMGCKRSWRQHLPCLPHEKENPSAIYNEVVAGLAGIQALIRTREIDLSQIDGSDARRATHYSVNEINGFAPWFPALVAHHPEVATDVLSKCIRGEWLFAADRKHVHEVMSDIAWRGEPLTSLVRSILLELLSAGDPPNDAILRYALTMLLKGTSSPSDLIPIARSRVRAYPPASPRYLLWLAILLQIDAQDAFAIIDGALASSPTPGDLLLRVCSALNTVPPGFEQAPVVAKPDYQTPENLARFIRLAYQHVRVPDDVDPVGRSGGSDARDAAQNFRNGLLIQLAGIQTRQARDILFQLANDAALSEIRDWIIHLAEQLTERLADLDPWTADDVRKFATDHETNPKTDTELFRIARKRLVDIKHDVERSDNSLREEVRADDREEVLRRWLARKLYDRSRHRYTVPQEEEIDQRERPDLRIESPNTAPVSLEIKWAHNWTLEELLDGLENQLVGQYLRAHNSRYAVYVLGIIGPERRWRAPGGQMTGFDEVVAAVCRRARELETTRSDVAGIYVIAIDFRSPATM